jgi:hypothetical protein
MLASLESKFSSSEIFLSGVHNSACLHSPTESASISDDDQKLVSMGSYILELSVAGTLISSGCSWKQWLSPKLPPCHLVLVQSLGSK